MAEADVDVVLKSVHNPSLCLSLSATSPLKVSNVVEPVTDVPEGWTFLRQLPEKVRKDGGLGAHCVML